HTRSKRDWSSDVCSSDLVSFPTRLEDGIGALSYDARYSRVIQKCFGQPPDVDVCKKFLTASASAYNKRALPGGKLTHYEIQKWKIGRASCRERGEREVTV